MRVNISKKSILYVILIYKKVAVEKQEEKIDDKIAMLRRNGAAWIQ
jgi:hypothetical protein